MKVIAGSRYEEFKKEMLRIEFESQLERQVLSEEDFRHACLDYLGLGQIRRNPEPLDYKDIVFACYSCGRTASEPQIVLCAEGVVGFHMECIRNEALRHVMPNRPFCGFMPPKRLN